MPRALAGGKSFPQVVQLADTGTTSMSTRQLEADELRVLKHLMEYTINRKVGSTVSFLHGFSSTPEAMFSSGAIATVLVEHGT